MDKIKKIRAKGTLRHTFCDGNEDIEFWSYNGSYYRISIENMDED